jgi:hypothetical protein
MKGNPALLSVMLGAAGLFISSSATADRTQYRSAHPIPEELEGFFCYIDSLHTHTYTPDEAAAAQFVRHQEGAVRQLEFVGDPTNEGYEGPLIGYADAHPYHFEGGSSEVDQSCEIEGSHFHLHTPIDPSQFEDHNGTYYFGSYKEVLEARRSKRKSRKAEERSRRRSRRAARATKKRAKRSSRKSATRTKSTKSKKTTKSKKSTAKTASKPAKKTHRSWMDRRRGR